ncbi:MAG TPA: tryptophan halogenase family protein [Tepidisphaeraceae bacterium]
MLNGVIKKVIVLGGGSAGFMAAGTIKLYLPNVDVLVIRSKDIGIIGVGEGSTIALTDFLHQFLKVKPKTFFDVARPTWKLGLKFIWGPREYFHYTFAAQCDARVPGAPLHKPIGYYLDREMENWDPCSALMSRERIFVPTASGQPAVHLDLAYHFENERFVEFLQGYAQAVGCRVMDDTVSQVSQDENGVSGLVLQSGQTETADLYVDASGFASLLLGKTLGEPFVPYRSSLFCDRAVVGGWNRTDEPIRPYTTCETMNSGWCWQIEHEGRINRGYVYSSAFISDADAEAEFRAKSPKVGPTRIVKFLSGRYRDGWVKNVVAVGNSSGFVEPLEATALGLIAIQCRLIVGTLIDSDRELRPTQLREFNKHHQRIWDNVRGFIAMHYKFNTRIETPFWRECREKTDLADAAPLVEYFRENGPSGFWGPTLLDSFEPFRMGGYATLLTGMGLPHRRAHVPTERELQWLAAWRERNRRLAERGMSVAEAIRAVHQPDWTWGNWSSSKALYA